MRLSVCVHAYLRASDCVRERFCVCVTACVRAFVSVVSVCVCAYV